MTNSGITPGIHHPVFLGFGSLLPEPTLREFIPLMRFLAQPIGGHKFPSVGVIVCNTPRPAAPCMDAGTADARVVMVLFEVVAEVTDQGMIDPDLANAVFPKGAVHEFGNGLPNPTESYLPCPEDPENSDNAAIIGLPFRTPDLSERRECRRSGQNDWDRCVLAKFFVNVPHQLKVPVIVKRLTTFMHRNTPAGMGHRVEFH